VRKTTSFKQWAQRLQEYASSSELLDQLEYWREQASKEVPPLPLSCTEEERAALNSVGDTAQVEMSLSEAQTRVLLQEVPTSYHTQIQEVLLSALALGYARWSGESRLRVDVEGHGREQEAVGGVDVSRTVGWFTTLYPVVLEVEGKQSAREAVRRVKEELRRVPGGGLGYGLLRWMSESEEVRGSVEGVRSGGSSAEMSFNYLGQLDQVLSGSKMLGVCEEGSGRERGEGEEREYVMEVGGSVVEGRLRMVWSYSRRMEERARVEELGRRVMEVLGEVIEGRGSAEEAVFTPSDFPLARLDEQKLSKLSSLLNNLDEYDEYEAAST
jgi:non-ribosomal peptide synthase protein (TIGR01720 family)